MAWAVPAVIAAAGAALLLFGVRATTRDIAATVSLLRSSTTTLRAEIPV